MRRDLAAVAKTFGTVDVIERANVRSRVRSTRSRSASRTRTGRYGAAMLALRAGRYPNRAGEVAVTDRVADAVPNARVGHAVDLGDVRRTVVGIVENPADLNDEFALVSSLPARLTTVDGPGRRRPAASSATWVGSARPAAASAAGRFEYRGDDRAHGRRRGLVLGLSTVALLLVALVATAGFVVVAQRRTRQLGMLAAIGATGRHLRLVMLINGAVVGAGRGSRRRGGRARGVARFRVAPRGRRPVIGSTGSTFRGGSSGRAAARRRDRYGGGVVAGADDGARPDHRRSWRDRRSQK